MKEEIAICPVSHEEITKSKAIDRGFVKEFQEKTYYMCCAGCLAEFDNDPSAYINHDH